MPTFTSGADTYTVSAAGTYSFDMLAGDDRLNVYGGTNVTAHMGLGNDLVILKAALNTIYGDAGLDRFDVYIGGAVIDGGADSDTINVRANVDLTAHGGLGDDRFNFYADALNVTLYGDDNNDDFYGYNQTISGSLYGGAGNDYFVQFGNRDGQVVTLYGGLGNDIYRADALNPATFVENALEGTDTVQVARGITYTLPTNIENISVQGFSGSSAGTAATLTGNVSNNAIVGHNNVETIYGLDGNDRLSGKGGNDTLDGGNGNDYLDGGSGNDIIGGGTSGNDTLQGRAGDDAMAGGSGDDTYYIDSLSDVIIENGGDGTDTVRATAGYFLPSNVENGILQGTANHFLSGNNLDNVLSGNSGDNQLYGGDGNDTLKGGDGNDSLSGEGGMDLLIGGDGDDSLLSASTLDDDTLIGGAGNDYLTGNGTLTGGVGDDTYTVGNSSAIIIENAGEGHDQVTLYGSYTLAANVEDGFVATSNPTSLGGNSMDNRLAGNSGVDAISGAEGNDRISGSWGADTLTGGAGDDTFLYFEAGESTSGSLDHITDFLSVAGTGGDKLDFSAIDADTGTAGDQAFGYTTTTATAHSIWYGNVVDNGNGTYEVTIYGDTNGDTTPELQIQVHFLSSYLDPDDLIV